MGMERKYNRNKIIKRSKPNNKPNSLACSPPNCNYSFITMGPMPNLVGTNFLFISLNEWSNGTIFYWSQTKQWIFSVETGWLYWLDLHYIARYLMVKLQWEIAAINWMQPAMAHWILAASTESFKYSTNRFLFNLNAFQWLDMVCTWRNK